MADIWRGGGTLMGVLLLSACAGSVADPDGDVRVQHYAVANAEEGTPLRLFFFAPDAPRDIDERMRIARSAIQANPACTWRDAPPIVIAEATARLGTAYADRLLVAPVTCVADPGAQAAPVAALPAPS